MNTALPTTQPYLLLLEEFRDKLRKWPLPDRLACRFNFHRKIEHGNISFCESCYFLFSGNEELLNQEIAEAETLERKSNALLQESTKMTFAYEEHCASVNLEDRMVIGVLNRVRDRLLKTSPNKS